MSPLKRTRRVIAAAVLLWFLVTVAYVLLWVHRGYTLGPRGFGIQMHDERWIFCFLFLISPAILLPLAYRHTRHWRNLAETERPKS